MDPDRSIGAALANGRIISITFGDPVTYVIETPTTTETREVNDDDQTAKRVQCGCRDPSEGGSGGYGGGGGGSDLYGDVGPITVPDDK